MQPSLSGKGKQLVGPQHEANSVASKEQRTQADVFPTTRARQFNPAEEGDWVLVLDSDPQ
jgi:hypothetical protein